MKLPSELLLLTLSLLQPTGALPTPDQPISLHRRSASFRSLGGLTKLTHDYSTAESFSHPTKFFHESTFSPHYDGRFASDELPHQTRLFHLRLMLKAYTDTMERIGVRTWLMHGCLLGWWWNARIMPWDTDVDFMVDERGINELGGWWNMSVHHFTADRLGISDESTTESSERRSSTTEEEDTDRLRKRILQEEIIQDGKRYLLEINPHYTNTSTRDKENVIDARWIDTSTGLFIDITTLHIQPVIIPPYDPNNPSSVSNAPVAQHPTTSDDNPTADLELYTKDQHAYSQSQMFPLRSTTFENVRVSVPYDYEELLLDEYGPKAITHRWYRGYRFDAGRHEWVLAADGEGGVEDVEVDGSGKDGKGGRMRVGERARGGKAYLRDDQ